MGRQFSVTEPLVGEIVGLRTFRVDESGTAAAALSDQAWYDGTNVASAMPPTGERPRSASGRRRRVRVRLLRLRLGARRRAQPPDPLRASRRVGLGTGGGGHPGRARRVRPHRRVVARPGASRSGSRMRIAGGTRMRASTASATRCSPNTRSRCCPATAADASSAAARAVGPTLAGGAVLALGLLPWRFIAARSFAPGPGARLDRDRALTCGDDPRSGRAAVALLLFAARVARRAGVRSGRLAVSGSGAARRTRGRRRIPARAASRLLPGHRALRRGRSAGCAPIGSVE